MFTAGRAPKCCPRFVPSLDLGPIGRERQHYKTPSISELFELVASTKQNPLNSAVELHSDMITCAKFLYRDQFEQYCVTSSKDGKTKIWPTSRLVGQDSPPKAAFATYVASAEVVSCLETLGTCMGIPMFAMGNQEGVLKVAVVAPTSKTRDLTVATWQVTQGGPIHKISQRLHSSILATLSDHGVKMWSYSVGHEGLRPKLLGQMEVDHLSSPRRQYGFGGLSEAPSDIGWSYPDGNLVLSMAETSALLLVDLDRLSSSEPIRSVSLDSDLRWNPPLVSK